jgi:hypothetical protein
MQVRYLALALAGGLLAKTTFFRRRRNAFPPDERRECTLPSYAAIVAAFEHASMRKHASASEKKCGGFTRGHQIMCVVSQIQRMVALGFGAMFTSRICRGCRQQVQTASNSRVCNSRVCRSNLIMC